MYCDGCGSSITKGAEFCETCGQPVSHQRRTVRLPLLLGVIAGVALLVLLIAVLRPCRGTNPGPGPSIAGDGQNPASDAHPESDAEESAGNGDQDADDGDSQRLPEGDVPPSAETEERDVVPADLRTHVQELRRRAWPPSPAVAEPELLYSLGDRTMGTVEWRPQNGPVVRLSPREVREGDPELDENGRVLAQAYRLRIMAEYPGSTAGGEVLITEPHVSAGSYGLLQELRVLAIARADGLLLLAFDVYWWEDLQRDASTRPLGSRRVLLAWDQQFSQPIEVQLWDGKADASPPWSRW